MSVFAKLKGIIGNIFMLGIGSDAHGLKHHEDGVSVVGNDEVSLANAVVARPQGANQNQHASTYLDVKERIIDIEFAFDGASPPTPGTNTGKYGICHTSGSTYQAGNIYLDTGTALQLIPMYHMMACAPRIAVSGTVSMIVDGLYIAEGSAAPWDWTLKGDGTVSMIGIVQSIEVSFTYSDFAGGSKTSTASIPTDAKIIRTFINVTTAFTSSANPTVSVIVDGVATDTAVRETTDQNLTKIAQFDIVDEIRVMDGGPVRLQFSSSGAVTAGVGYCLVEYVTPNA